MTYEEWYKVLSPVTYKAIGDFKPQLKMELEDMKQEAAMLIFELMDKLNELEETGQKYLCYYRKCIRNKFKNIKDKEHRQLLYLEVNDIIIDDNGREIYLVDMLEKDSIVDYPVTDSYFEYKKEYHRNWYQKLKQENPERYSKLYGKEHYEKTKEKYKTTLYSSKYYQENIERERAKAREYYQAHKDEINAKKKAYYQAHKDEVIERERANSKAYYQAHKDEINAKKKVYYQAHKDEINAKRKEKRKLNKLKEELLNEN